MNPFLAGYLERSVRRGTLEMADARGRVRRFGDGTGTPIRARFLTRRAEWAVTLDAELRLGEAYMDGSFRVEAGTIYDFLDIVLADGLSHRPPAWMKGLARLRFLLRRPQQNNTSRRARRNVARHYDLDNRIYELFLDSDWQYSCAYFESPDDDLETAQHAKKRHIAAKLALAPGQRVLDIGCGWGGLGLYLARTAGVDVTGVTLSDEQEKTASRRAVESGLGDRARFLLQDYRSMAGTFDRIVSVGMFEHVGVGHYDEFFATCRKLLKDDGVMLLHAIGRSEGPGVTNPWIARYIFPGGYIPALSEVVPAIERQGLFIADVEILRYHYAETLKAWRERFTARWDEAKRLRDERFCRMWEFYLAGAEIAFRRQGMMVFQIQLAKDQATLPITRDHMFEAENRLRRGDRDERWMRLAGE